MSLFRNKKAEVLEKQLIEQKKENEVLSDRVKEIDNKLYKNEDEKRQLLVRVSSLEKEKQIAIDNCEALKQQVYKDENERNLISANFSKTEKENKILLKKINDLEVELSNNNEKMRLLEHAEFSLTLGKKDVSIDKIESYIENIRNTFTQKNELITKYQTYDEFNGFFQHKVNFTNVSYNINNIIYDLKNLNKLLKVADRLETLSRIEFLLNNFKRSKKIMALIAQFDDDKTIELYKLYMDLEKAEIMRDLDHTIELLADEEKQLIESDIKQLEVIRDRLKKELLSTGYRSFLTIQSRKDSIEKNLITPREILLSRLIRSLKAPLLNFTYLINAVVEKQESKQ